jgi:PPM family protein phosphatase
VSALALSCAVRTDTGPVRPHNEDAAFATPRLAAVADGVGGHAAGEVASRAPPTRSSAPRSRPARATT